MARRKIPLAEGEFFHVYNRGNSKQQIFIDDHDRDRFVKLLYLCNSKKSFNFRNDIVRKGIDVWDFDSVPPRLAGGRARGDENKLPISIFLEKLCKTYAQYFNAKYKRTGSLFESKFKSVHITDDPQAKYNFSYIHLNPVKLIDKDWRKNGIKDFVKTMQFLQNYKWSSYQDHKGVVRPENKILDLDKFPKYFQDVKDFDIEIIEWLKNKLP